MSEFNKDMISDESLRHLLQLCLLEGDDNDDLTKQLMDMETTFAIGGETFNLPAIPGEKLLLNKLKMSLGKGIHLKWLFTAVVAAAAGTGLYLSSGPAPESPTNFQAPIPITAENPVPPDSVPPVPPAPKTEDIRSWPLPMMADAGVDNPFVDYAADYPHPVITPEPKPFEFFQAPDSPVIDHSTCKGGFNIPIEVGQYNLDTVFNGINKIELDATFGDIDVSTTSSSTTSLSALMQVDGKFRKNKGYYSFTYVKTGSLLRITLRPGTNINMVGRNMQLSGQFRIVTPASTEVSLKNSSGNVSVKGLRSASNSVDCAYGNVTVEDMASNVNIVARSGQVSARSIAGALNVQDNYGHIVCKDIKGPANLQSSSGQISAENMEGMCKIEARYGHITVSDVLGETELNSSSGNIVAKNIRGQNLNVVSRYGHIDLKNIEARLNVESSSGNLSINGLTGNARIDCTYGRQNLYDITGNLVTFSRSGDISISRLKGDLELESNYGHVNINESEGKVKIVMTSGNLIGMGMKVRELMDVYSKYGNVKVQLENDYSELSFDLDAPSGKIKVSKGTENQTASNGRLSINHGSTRIRVYTASGSQEFL